MFFCKLEYEFLPYQLVQNQLNQLLVNCCGMHTLLLFAILLLGLQLQASQPTALWLIEIVYFCSDDGLMLLWFPLPPSPPILCPYSFLAS